jgi:preprotein translocase subunit SecD
MATVYIETITHVDNKNGKHIVTTDSVSRIINIATIQGAFSTQFSITGMESPQASENLALLLRSGAYPIAPAIVEEKVVGPSMGKENIEKGEQSTVVGFFLVVLFMLIYYRFFGFVADMALLVNLIFIVAVMSVLHATMTLPGIAGIVLTIGMAVDANVLINERIREELRLGMTPQAAISAGYGRAFSTIVDANVTTLIVAVVLFGIGSGPVKSFAITLIIGLLTSMLSAIFFTRSVVNLHYGYRVKLKKLSIGIRVKE